MEFVPGCKAQLLSSFAWWWEYEVDRWITVYRNERLDRQQQEKSRQESKKLHSAVEEVRDKTRAFNTYLGGLLDNFIRLTTQS